MKLENGNVRITIELTKQVDIDVFNQIEQEYGQIRVTELFRKSLHNLLFELKENDIQAHKMVK